MLQPKYTARDARNARTRNARPDESSGARCQAPSARGRPPHSRNHSLAMACRYRRTTQAGMSVNVATQEVPGRSPSPPSARPGTSRFIPDLPKDVIKLTGVKPCVKHNHSASRDHAGSRPAQPASAATSCARRGQCPGGSRSLHGQDRPRPAGALPDARLASSFQAGQRPARARRRRLSRRRSHRGGSPAIGSKPAADATGLQTPPPARSTRKFSRPVFTGADARGMA